MTGMVLNLLASPVIQIHVPAWEVRAKPDRWDEEVQDLFLFIYLFIPSPPRQLGVPGQCGHWTWPLGRSSVCSVTTRGDWGNNREREEREKDGMGENVKLRLHLIYNTWGCTTSKHSKPNLVGLQHLFASVKFACCWAFSESAELRLLQHLSVSRFSRSC